MIRHVHVIFVFLVCFAASAAAYGQDAQVQGQVLDPSGAGIPKALIRVVDQRTGRERTTETDGSGQYAVPALAPSLYKIFVQAGGFSTAVSNPITLNVAQNAVLDFRLRMGTTSTDVQVDADNSGVNTTDASVSTVIDRQFVENLPLNGRSFQSLLYLAPVITPNVTSANTALSQGQFVVNGQRGDANYWLIDGVSGNIGIGLTFPGAGMSGAIGATNALGGTNALVSVDAMQEFRVETSAYSPEFGRVPGGQIAIQTRSGTNQYHGALFEYLRNGDLDATDWFADHEGLAKPLEIQNDFGGVLGGPILKNKTFFFFSAEALRLHEPTTFLGTVPDLDARAAAVPAMKPYMNMFPLPKPGAADVGPGYVLYSATFSNPGSASAYSLRVDHHLSDRLNLFARYSHAPSSAEQRGVSLAAANGTTTESQITKTGTAGATWVQSANIVDDLRFNYSVSGGQMYGGSDNFGGATPFPSANLFAPGADYKNSWVLYYVAVGTNMREQQGFMGGGYQRQYNLVDTLSEQCRAHNLKFGVDYRRLLPTGRVARESLIPVFTDMSQLETGNTPETVIVTSISPNFLLQNVGAFAQDTWRVNSRLNLTYGLRWDREFVPTASDVPSFGAVTGFSTTDLSNLALAPQGTPTYHAGYTNVAPRIGGAYRVLTDPNWGTVLRGGFGVFYGLATTELFNLAYDYGYYPLGALVYFPNTIFPTTPDVAAIPPIVPPDPQNGGWLFGVDPHLKLPYALEWNATIEQSLGSAQTLSVAYVGAADRRLVTSEEIANPNPNYAYATLIGNAGTSSFESLQVQFKRRMARGLQALASYAWSHSIDTGSYGEYLSESFSNASSNRGSSDYDIRHMFSAALTYDVPAIHANWITRAITSSWATDNIVQIHSGPPIDIQDSEVNTEFAGGNGASSRIVFRPDVVPGQPAYLTSPQYPGRKALNPASFANPPIDPNTGNPIRQGNLSRNARRALGLEQWDFAVRREFPLFEDLKLQFRAELFNVLNHPNFGPFDNQFGGGNTYFGQATQMLNQYLSSTSGNGSQNPLYTPGTPRSGEFALKLIF